MADFIRAHQVILQVSGLHFSELSELCPDRDGTRVGSWGVHGTLTGATDFHEAINSKDTNQDGTPDDWPPGMTYMPEYVFLDTPTNGDYIDFHLKAGNGAYRQTDHDLIVHTQMIVDDEEEEAFFGAKLYQGNPAAGGTLIYDSGPSYAFSDEWEAPFLPKKESMGEGTVLDIPEGYIKRIDNYEDLWVRIYIYPGIGTTVQGRVAVGRICLRYPAPPRGDEGPGYTSLWISDIDWTSRLSTPSLKITKDLQNRSTLEAVLKDITGAIHLQPGEEVYFFFEDSCVFGGRIETVDEEYPGQATGGMFIKIRCTDWTRVLDRFTIADSWEGETLEQIVHEIFYLDAPDLVEKEGFTIGTLPAFNFDKINFRREKVSTCLREICQLAGLYWYVHPYTRTLTIRENLEHRAPWTIGDGYQDYRRLTFSRSLDQYRNIQWLVGGKAETSKRTETFHGHPSSDEATRPRTFNLSYPVAKKPRIWVDRGSGDEEVPEARIGVRGVDLDTSENATANPDTYCRWFWNRDENEISQSSADDPVNNATLGTDDVLTVEYVGLFPLVGYEKNQAGINARAAFEQGSGVYESVEEDEKIDSLALAEKRCLRLLQQFGRVPATIRYEIDYPGLEPGHLQPITIARHGVDAQYLVEEIAITFPGTQLLTYRCSVQALDGERQEGWVDFWRETQRAGRKFSLRENEVVGVLQTEDDTVTIGDVLAVAADGSVVPPDWYDDPFTVALYGVRTIGGEEYDLAICGRSRYGD